MKGEDAIKQEWCAIARGKTGHEEKRMVIAEVV
jgi:hypothetical protein